MAQQLEKPRVTEIKVRMDCNGCVQKIKKALHGINGIYDSYIDFPQQKLTIIGWADPEKIVKAIKKTRKTATICSHSEISDPPAQQPTEPAPAQPAEEAPAAPDATNPPPAEAPAEPPKDPPPENPPSDAIPSASANNASESQPPPPEPPKPKDVEEVHVYYHPPDYGYRYSYGHSYRGHWSNYPNGPKFQQEPGIQQEPSPPVATTQSHNTYKPSPDVTNSYNIYKPSPYVAEDEYIRPSPQYTHYNRAEHYREDYHNSSSSSSNGNISSMFSDENPNACRIV